MQISQNIKTYTINLLVVLFIAAGIFVVIAGRNTKDAQIFKFQEKTFNKAGTTTITTAKRSIFLHSRHKFLPTE